MAERNNLIETMEPKTRQASTVFKQGDWVMANGTGEFAPLEPTFPVAGLCMEEVNAQVTNNFDETSLIQVDTVSADVDRWLMDVGTGTAEAFMEGETFDVDAGDASLLDVSAAGTQFQVVRVISATQVEVKVNLLYGQVTS